MSRIILKIIPALIFWGVFILAVFNTPYPESLAQANSIQIGSFFAPLFLALIFTVNIFLKNFLLSFFITLCLSLLLILKALDSLNFVTGILIIIAGVLLFSYFRKVKKNNLTKQTKIPKLTHLQRREK